MSMMLMLMVKDLTQTAHLCDAVMGGGQVCVQVSFFKMFSNFTAHLAGCIADHLNHTRLTLISKHHMNKLANQNKEHYPIIIQTDVNNHTYLCLIPLTLHHCSLHCSRVAAAFCFVLRRYTPSNHCPLIHLHR